MAKILWIGVGTMGFPISQNLLKAGHELTVLDTNPARVEKSVAAGATAAANMEQGVAGAEFIFTMVPDSAAMLAAITGPGGVAAYTREGQVVVDMSTVSVESSRVCGEAVEASGAMFLRCPVNGSTVFAESAKLTVICSGPREAYDRALPLLEKISQTRFYLGDGDKARLMKLAVNLMIGVSLEMFAEAAVLCEKGGIDWNTAIDVFEGSSIASPQLCFKFPPLRRRDFTPASFTKTLAKDLDLALEAAKGLGVYSPVTAATKQIYDACMARGNGDKDFSVILETIEAMSGL